MSEYRNRAIVLKQRPQGEIQEGDLAMEARPVRAPGKAKSSPRCSGCRWIPICGLA
ncbi:hypothetical protein ACFQGA_14415 [Marinobacter koreensis]|uniref:hypothetical protein n=1 Tax=Marinobacter koreensis TaxID=335974 RepID=UPI00360AD07B